MTERKNVIILIVDSVRHYSTGGLDDRDKLEMMDRFENESIYFPLTITSAPSSIMSLSSMLTSLPAYYIARNYDDFKYDNNQFISLHNILKDYGYDVRSLFNARELRFLFGDIIKHVDEKFWTEDINNNQLNWSNAQMNNVLENFLKSNNMKKPFFLIAWYNVRLDPKTSQHIEKGIDILKKYNVWDDSIFILGADHGYMDPRRGYTPEKLKELGLSHDLLMSDDNIRIPFYLRYPGSPTKKIKQPVSTLDFLPTILSLLNIEYPETKTYQMHGDNLLPLINGNQEAKKKILKRKVRSDARFFAQSNRATALRNDRYKYVIRPDKKIEEFFDINVDQWEENNLIQNKDYEIIIDEFRDLYFESEKQILEFQYRYLLNKIPSTLKSKNNKVKIIVLGLGEAYYLDNISKILREFWGGNVVLDFIVSINVAQKMKNLNVFSNTFTYNIVCPTEFNKDLLGQSKYDLLVILTDSYNSNNCIKCQRHLLSKIKFTKKFVFDPNMELVDRSKKLRDPKLIFKVIKEKNQYYLKNPKMIFHHFIKWWNIITK